MADKDIEQLVLQMSADLRKMERALDGGVKRFDKAARDIERRQRELDKNLEKLGEKAGAGLDRLSLVAGAAFGAITGYALKAAGDANEIANAFDVAFGSMADDARDFARTFSAEVGRSFYETQESMSRARLVLDGFGFSGEQALDVVKKIQERSVDIGSLFNVQDADAFAAIISGLTGETEPMKRFGVVVNETAVKAELLRLGFKGNASQASEQAKVIARLNIMLRGTAKAQGDAANTADSFSNQQKRLAGEVRDSAVELGQRFLPVAQDVLDWANDALEAFNNMPTGVQNASLALLALVATGGPIARAIKGLVELIKTANAARLALAGVGGASAAAGAGGAGGAAAGGIAGLGVAGGAVAAGAGLGVALPFLPLLLPKGYKNLQAARKDPTKASLEQLEKGLLEARTFLDNSQKAGGNPNSDAVRAIVRDINNLAGEVARRRKPSAAAAAASPDSAFTLDDDQLKPGGDQKGKGKKGEAAHLAKQALAREERLNNLLGRAGDDLLQARIDQAVEAKDRLALELQAIDNERQARAKDLDLAVQQKELTAAEAKQVALAEEKVRQQEEENLRRKAARQTAQDELDAQQQVAAFSRDTLDLLASNALTQRERAAIELELLKLQQDERRRALQAAADDETLTQAKRDAAKKILAGLPEHERLEREGLRTSSGPAAEARGIAAGVVEENDLVGRTAEMYAEIDKLRRADQLSEADAAQAKAAINARYQEQRLANTQSFFGELATLADSGNKRLAAIGKAAAIAQATIDGILAVQKALAAAPPPLNFALAAAAGAAAAVNVAKIAGLKDGGLVTGPGGPRDDKVLRRLSNGEFVVNAKATARNRGLLEDINAGRAPGLKNGGPVGRMGPPPALRSAQAARVPGATGGASAHVYVDARGALIWEGELERMKQYADTAALQAGAGSVQVAQSSVPARLQRQAGRRLGR